MVTRWYKPVVNWGVSPARPRDTAIRTAESAGVKPGAKTMRKASLPSGSSDAP